MKQLKNDSQLETRRNVDLSAFTTFGLPGRAAYLLETNNPGDLREALQKAKALGQKYFIISGGSNIVISNNIYSGLVIVYRENGLAPDLSSLTTNKNRIEAFGSVPLWKVVKYSIENGLAGLEYLSGIPGNLSGAIYGNAGAYGHSISEVVEKVLIFDGKRERWLTKADCGFSYRDSVFKKKKTWVILSVLLKLKTGERAKLRAYHDKIVAERAEKYSNIKCPGSFFKNVLISKVSKSALSKVDKNKIIDGKIPAGYLLESVGAKGMRVGGLYIADYHGNLIVNDGKATFKDVQKLVAILKERVKDKFGIKLEEEIRYLI